MDNHKSEANFVQAVASTLVGRKSWGTSLGHGSFLILEFGAPIQLDDGAEQGEYHLWIYGSAWRIEKDQKFVMGSQDDREYISANIKDVLDDMTLQSILVNPLSLDTIFEFDSNISLYTFSVSTDMEHWLLYLPNNKVLKVGPGFTYQAVKEAE